MKKTLLLLFCSICFLASFANTTPAQAFYSVLDTGEIISSGKYRGILETQLIATGLDGANVVGRFDMGVDDASALRFLLGTGTISFQTGLFYKWVPIPDFEDQPAIGVMAGGLYSRFEGTSTLSFRISPLVSKKFEIEYGTLWPYASLPTGLEVWKGETRFPLQLALGTEFKSPSLDDFTFFAELGINVNDAFTYISIAAAYYFDDPTASGYKY